MWPAQATVRPVSSCSVAECVKLFEAASATAMMITPMCTTMPPLARPTRPPRPWRRVASTSWRRADPAAKPPSPNATQRCPAVGADGHRERDRTRAASTPARTTARGAARPTPCATAAPGATPIRNSSDEPDRHRQPVEVRGADDGPAVLERLDEQREDRAEQHDEREHREQHVVGEERSLARDRRVDRTGRPQPIAAPGDQPERHDHDDAEERQQPGTDRPVAERVHAS